MDLLLCVFMVFAPEWEDVGYINDLLTPLGVRRLVPTRRWHVTSRYVVRYFRAAPDRHLWWLGDETEPNGRCVVITVYGAEVRVLFFFSGVP